MAYLSERSNASDEYIIKLKRLFGVNIFTYIATHMTRIIKIFGRRPIRIFQSN